MSEKHIVVQGAICKCQFGTLIDKLKVLSHQKEYANDKEGTQKLIATTKEIGATTFENNSFGNCTKMGSPPPPCKPMVQEWKGFYEDVILTNGGKILVEDSKAVCAIAGSPCIEVIKHGQTAELSSQNLNNANPFLQSQLNPLADVKSLSDKEPQHPGISDSTKKQG